MDILKKRAKELIEIPYFCDFYLDTDKIINVFNYKEAIVNIILCMVETIDKFDVSEELKNMSLEEVYDLSFYIHKKFLDTTLNELKNN